MMSQGKKSVKKLIITLVIILIILIIATLGFLYLTTDLFKPSQVLFGKYLGKAIENVESLIEDEEGQEYQKLLNENKYKSTTSITANYVENMGTTDEKTTNVINNLELLINGKTEISSEYDHKDITLKKSSEKVAEIEYLKSENKYGIKFSDLFQQFLVVEDEQISNIEKQIGIISDGTTTSSEAGISNSFAFSNEEIEELNTKYSNVIIQSFNESNFVEEKDRTITVKDKAYSVDSYTLKTTKEELNNVYIKLLETVKQDETILKRVDMIEEASKILATNINQNNSNTTVDEENTTSYRKKFTEYVDQIINGIKNKNIGNDEVKITVYESQSKTVRVLIETAEYKIYLDTIITTESKYVRIFNEIYDNQENSNEIIINRTNNKLNIEWTNKLGTDETKMQLESARTITAGKQERENVYTYDTGKNKITIKMTNQDEIVKDFDEKVEYEENNTVLFNSLSDEELVKIMEVLNDALIEKQKEIHEKVNGDELLNILKTFGVIPNEITINDLTALTKSEVSRFNADFELYKGQDLPVDSIESLLNIVKDNLYTVEVLSDKSIKLNISKNVKNEELANKVIEIIKNESNKDKKYTVNIEYDDESGIIKDIIIVIQQ